MKEEGKGRREREEKGREEKIREEEKRREEKRRTRGKGRTGKQAERVTASRDIERGGSSGGCDRNPDRLTRKEGDRRRRIVEFFLVVFEKNWLWCV